MYGILLATHILAATVWTGGHLILATVILPGVLKQRSVQRLVDFESAYEKIGMPALLIQVITGLMLAYHYLPDPRLWLDTSSPLARGIMIKLTLLALTVMLALDARFRVIPQLSAAKLTDMAWHIIPVTIISVLFVLTGVSFRTGWLV